MGKLATDPIDNIYPLTLIKDRYNGAYSGGKWLAFHMDHDLVSGAIHGGDLTAAATWNDWWRPVGRGDCPVLAAQDLGTKLEALNGEG